MFMHTPPAQSRDADRDALAISMTVKMIQDVRSWPNGWRLPLKNIREPATTPRGGDLLGYLLHPDCEHGLHGYTVYLGNIFGEPAIDGAREYLTTDELVIAGWRVD